MQENAPDTIIVLMDSKDAEKYVKQKLELHAKTFPIESKS